MFGEACNSTNDIDDRYSGTCAFSLYGKKHETLDDCVQSSITCIPESDDSDFRKIMSMFGILGLITIFFNA